MATKLLLKGALVSESGPPALTYRRADRTQGGAAGGAAVTVSGLTLVQLPDGGTPTFMSDQVETAITVSGTVSVNLWGSESAAGVNARLRVDLHVYRAGSELAAFGTGRMAAELSTTNAVRTFTITPTSTALQVGDRILVKVYAEHNTAGSAMGSGTVTLRYNGAAGADGDAFVSFTENVRLTRIRTIKSAFGDYTSMVGHEAGEQGTQTGLGPVWGENYAINDTTAVTIDGWTLDADDYLWYYAPAGERHPGFYDASKYKLDVNTTGVSALVIMENFVRIKDLQIAQRHASGLQAVAVGYAGAGDVRIESCIIPQAASTADGHGILCTGGTLTIRNSVIYGCGNLGVAQLTSVAAPAVTMQNCDVVKCATAIYCGDSTMVVTNCYVGGNSSSDYAAVGTLTVTTSMHSSAAVQSGSTANTAYSNANFVDTGVGSENLHLAAGSALIGQGTDLSGSFTTDIDGETRVAPWDVGADELVVPFLAPRPLVVGQAVGRASYW